MSLFDDVNRLTAVSSIDGGLFEAPWMRLPNFFSSVLETKIFSLLCSEDVNQNVIF
jgi:hypothetical protein